MDTIRSLEPPALWGHFETILGIPRGSGEEQRIRSYVLEVAERHGLDHRTDEAGNVVVRVPASPGLEGAPVVVLQSHLDMVEEKDADVQHDFARDPIRARVDGEYLTATGTTLGADNGIGVAAMLALLETADAPHGPLELLFTVEEETGLKGAARLDPGLITGRLLINLDSEEEGTLTVGCAGGGGSVLALPLGRAPVPDGRVAAEVRVRGLRGGHSGLDIHLQRANALKVLARVLHAALPDAPFRVAELEGGNKHNAIPREARARVVLQADALPAFCDAADREIEAVRAEFAASDPDLACDVRQAELPGEAWTEDASRAAVHLLEALPHGVMAMSLQLPGLVESSTNVSTARVEGDTLRIGTSSRSSVGSALLALRRRIRAVGALAGCQVEEGSAYPAWQPDLGSRLLAVAREVHEAELGVAPEIKAVHAGLECGLVGTKVPGMDMISFGPQIEFPHSPGERVHIDSVARFFRLLTATLRRVAS